MPTTFGSVLKEWRSIRRMSQLELSNVADVSARHISFLESGRSRPSRPMALHLAESLDIPRAERNRMLTAAGFSPMWHEHDLDAEEMALVHDALQWTLERHNPYPAVVLDRHWKVVDQNATSRALLAGLGLSGEISFLDEIVGDGTLRTMIDNWGEVGRYMLTRLRTESAAVGGDVVLDAAIERLAADDGVSQIDGVLPPVATVDFRIGDAFISLFSTIAQFGTAEDLALSELRIELFFPADEPTRAFLASLTD